MLAFYFAIKKDRNWRKTRSKTFIPTCVGVDPNRNWNDHFCGNKSNFNYDQFTDNVWLNWLLKI